jgi:hypothetical protein
MTQYIFRQIQQRLCRRFGLAPSLRPARAKSSIWNINEDFARLGKLARANTF